MVSDTQDDPILNEEEALEIDGMGIVDPDIDPDAIGDVDSIDPVDLISPVAETDVFANALLLADEAPEEKIEEEEDDFKEMADYMYSGYEDR